MMSCSRSVVLCSAESVVEFADIPGYLVCNDSTLFAALHLLDSEHYHRKKGA